MEGESDSRKHGSRYVVPVVCCAVRRTVEEARSATRCIRHVPWSRWCKGKSGLVEYRTRVGPRGGRLAQCSTQHRITFGQGWPDAVAVPQEAGLRLRPKQQHAASREPCPHASTQTIPCSSQDASLGQSEVPPLACRPSAWGWWSSSSSSTSSKAARQQILHNHALCAQAHALHATTPLNPASPVQACTQIQSCRSRQN